MGPRRPGSTVPTLKIRACVWVHGIGRKDSLLVKPIEFPMLIRGQFVGQTFGAQFIGQDDVVCASARLLSKVGRVKMLEDAEECVASPRND